MADPVPLIETTEGAARVQVPATGSAAERRGKDHVAGPGKIEGGLFYNPAMRFARDLTVLAIDELATRQRDRWEARSADAPTQRDEDAMPRPAPAFVYYDGLGATGVRGIRIAKETQPHVFAIVNDRSADACDMARKNIAANDATQRMRVTEGDFAHGMGDERADHVDVDPFGSPAPFIDSALRMVRDRGTLAVTATDMTALCGIYPNACQRRYDAVPWHHDGMHEAALRIVSGAITRNAARFDMAATPILAHATDHYVRVWMQVRRGAQRADAAVREIGWLIEEADGTRRLVHDRDEAARLHAPTVIGNHRAPPIAGPMWTGTLQDAEFVHALLDRLQDREDLPARPLDRFLTIAAEEADAPPMNYSMREWGRRLKVTLPNRETFHDALRDAGHEVSRSHIEGDLFKTDAPGSVIAETLRTLDVGPHPAKDQPAS